MKRIATILCLLMIGPAICYGQNADAKEDFVSAIHSEIFQATSSKINLYYAANLAWFTVDTTTRPSLKAYLPDQLLNELIGKAQKDTLPLEWNCSKLPFVKCIRDDSPEATASANNATIKVYDLSRPIFSEDGQYAIIATNTYEDLRFSGRCAYLFNKQKDGAWTKITQFARKDLSKR